MRQIIKQSLRDTKSVEGSNWFQIWAIFILSIATCTCGALFTWTSPAIPELLSPNFPGNITLEEASYLTMIPSLGIIFISPIFTTIMDKTGRKSPLLFIGLLHFAVWVITMVAESIYLFYVARFLNGMADAIIFTVLPTYMSEISTPKVRGSWGNLPTLNIYIGQLFINVIGGYTDIKTTAYIFSVLPIVFLAAFFFMPESPYYLIMKSQKDQAKRSLQILRRKHNVDEELHQLLLDVGRQTKEPGQWKDLLTNSTNRKAFVAGTFARGAQQFSGISSFSTYTVFLFAQAGMEFSSTISAIAYCLILAIMITLGSITLDKFGRKWSMVISCAGCSLILFSEFIYFYLKQFSNVDLSSITWFPLLGMILYVILYSIGLGIVPTLIIGELFSTSIKAKGVSALNFCFGAYVLSSTKIFQYFTSNFGLHIPFLLFFVCSFISTFVSYYVIPETKGKTLEEIQQSMKK